MTDIDQHTTDCVLHRPHAGPCFNGRRPNIEPSPDPVSHPTHYTSSDAKCSGCGKPIECIDVVQHLPYSLGCVVKYVWRHDLKGTPIEDLRKAAQYLQFEIARREQAAAGPARTFTAADIFPEQAQS